jgi:hypothetical protein
MQAYGATEAEAAPFQSLLGRDCLARNAADPSQKRLGMTNCIFPQFLKPRPFK